MEGFKKFQDQLVAAVNSQFRDDEQISPQIIEAFYSTPRHQFVNRYRNRGDETWIDVTQDNLEQHLSTLYADRPLVLFGSDRDFEARSGEAHVSTISQPSFVLYLINILGVKPGDTVFELGAASGWNSALISKLVGPTGRVVTAEIIPELADTAEQRLKDLGIENVTVVKGDAGYGCPEYAPYDCAMFTAGAFDLPRNIQDQIKVGGKILFVLKNKSGTDNLILLQKQANHFVSKFSEPCGFVPMTGDFHLKEMEEQSLEDLLQQLKISSDVVDRRQYWFGSGGKKNFLWRTAALRSFLSLYDHCFWGVTSQNRDDRGFAWSDGSGLAYAVAGELISYGVPSVADSLVSRIKDWVNIGMPTASNLDLKVVPSDIEVEPMRGEWICKRNEATFVWSLPKP